MNMGMHYCLTGSFAAIYSDIKAFYGMDLPVKKSFPSIVSTDLNY